MSRIELARVQRAYEVTKAYPLVGDFHAAFRPPKGPVRHCLCPGLAVVMAEGHERIEDWEGHWDGLDSGVIEEALGIDGAYMDGFISGVDDNRSCDCPFEVSENPREHAEWMGAWEEGRVDGAAVRAWLHTVDETQEYFHGALRPLA